MSESVASMAALKAENRRLRKALEFYADPETYFAIGFFPDRPCGSFMKDFSSVPTPWGHGTRKKPGKRARKALEVNGNGK